MKNIDIGFSSITERVFMGKSKQVKGAKDGLKCFTGEKIDITSKFLFMVEQYFEIGTSRVITLGKETLLIHIENTKEAKEKLIKSLEKQIGTQKNTEGN